MAVLRLLSTTKIVCSELNVYVSPYSTNMNNGISILLTSAYTKISTESAVNWGGVTRAKRGPAPARGGRGRAVSVRYGSCPAAGGAERDGVDGRRRLSPTAGESSVEALPPGWAAWSRGLEGRMRCELKGPMGWAGPALVGLRAQAVDWDGWLAGCAFWPEPRNSLKFYFLFIRIFTINK